jgi:DNA polymerase-1
MPTHALYGFARFLSDLLERRQPRYVAVAFDDSHGCSFRHRLYPAYKANRDATPVQLTRQFAAVPRILSPSGRRRVRRVANSRPTT